VTSGALVILLGVLWIAGSVRAHPPTTDRGAPDLVSVAGQTTPLLQYQGRLTDPDTGEPVPDGSYSMTFRLYDTVSGGTALWTETKVVSVEGGVFSTVLGESSALSQGLFDGQALWLGIAVRSDDEAKPRQPVLPVAYALSLVPGAKVSTDGSSTALMVINDGIGDALQVSGGATLRGDLSVDGSLIGATHTHWGESWSGSGAALTLRSTDTDSLVINNSGQDGVHIFQPQQMGIYVYEPSVSGFYVDYPGTTGLSVMWAGSHGVRVHQPGEDGLNVDSPGGDGLYVDSPADDGVHVLSATGDGFRVDKAGLNGLEVWDATYDGVQVNSAGRYGVQANTDGTYGFYTPDKIYAGDGYEDIAEHIDVTGDAGPGDVVVIDPEHDEHVVRSSRPYDPAVAGIISTDPAMVIGDAETQTPLALAGRVPCKVSAENGPIRRGDLLTTSSTPGHAMRATDPAPGTVLGKAMGELESGTGVITVLVTLH
jgi:hypothetical protein